MKFLRLCRILIVGILIFLVSNVYAEKTVLEEYITSSDNRFDYNLIFTGYNLLYTTYVFELTSQEWHPDEVDPGVWKHWLTIVEPRFLGKYTQDIPFFSLVQTDKALLRIIKGDEEHEERPSQASDLAVQIALQNWSIVAEIHGIPIGPVAFLDEQEETDWWDELNPFKDEDEDKVLRKEDSLQARAMDLALSTGDFTWMTIGPMVKAVIRGMDLIQEFFRQRSWGREIVREFVLTGHSKRGWTAWLTAAMDERVVGIAPTSYDLLNTPEQTALQETYWDERSEELKVYEEFDLYNRLESELGEQLIRNIDPFAYLERLNIPTLILVGTNDNYSNVDSVNIYLDDLIGDTRIFYDPNKGHDIQESLRANNTISSFYRHIVQGQLMPEFTWNDLTDGSFEVTPVTQTPIEVKLWTATNPSTRDFRETAGIQWKSIIVSKNENGSYTGTVPQPDLESYTAFFVELSFKDGKETDPQYRLSTPMTVLSGEE
jgi:PhoPQ-activated pathogenicity-related protein